MSASIGQMATQVAALAVGVILPGPVGAGLAAVIMAGGALLFGSQQEKPEIARLSPVSQQSRSLLLNKSASNEPIPVVYGSRQVGGTRVFVETTGSSNEYLHIVLVLSEGPIAAINTVYLNGIDCEDERFAGLVRVNKHLGDPDQLADSDLVSECEGWTEDHRLRGVAYVYVRLKYDSSAFSGMPTITADIDGRTVFDPRDDSTAFSNNPALCIRDYLTHEIYGRGIPESMIGDDSIEAAANYCDQLVAKGGESLPRYTCDGVVDTGSTSMEIVESMLTSCRACLVFSGGMHKLLIDKPETGAFTFDESNIVGAWSIAMGGKKVTYNRIRAHFFDPDREWQGDIEPVDDTTYRTADNGLLLEREIDLPFTASRITVHQIARINLNQSRQQITCEFRATIAGLECEVMDVVKVTHSTPGWSEKLFRVLAMTFIPDADEVRVQLREYDAAVYNFGTIAAADEAPDTTLPDPHDVAAPTALTLASGTAQLYTRQDGTVFSRLKASWTAPADVFVTSGGHVEIQHKQSADSTWINSGSVDGAETEFFILDVQDGEAYDVRVRSRNVIDAVSAWVTSTGHAVVGKTANPSDVARFGAFQNINVVTFLWTQIPDKDLAGYELRYTAQGAWSWANATVLTSVTKGTLVTNAALPPGAWTVGICASDTSGNYSTNATTYNITVSNANDVIVSQAEHAEWPGTLTNFIKHYTGKLVPKSQTPASEGGWETFDTFVYNPYPECTYEAEEVDLGFDQDGVRVYAAMQALLGPGETGVADPTLSIDYKDAGGSYDGWEEWNSGYADFRYLKGRARIDTGSGVACLTAMTVYADLPEREERGQNVTIDPGGTLITFSRQFNAAPNVQLTPQSAGVLRFPVYTGCTTTGFTAYILDSSGSDVGGVLDWRVVGA